MSNNFQFNHLESRLLTIFLFLIFVFFLYLRFSLVPLGYHYWDENAFKKASVILTSFPFREYYQKITLAEVGYLPIIPLILWTLGSIYKLIDPSFSLNTPLNTTLLYFLKFPAILSDVLIAVVIFFLLKKRGKTIGLLISCLYFMNPAFIYISSYWGQFESLYGLTLLLTLFFLQKNNYKAVLLMLSLSLLTKPQSILAIPIIIVYLIFFKKLELRDLFLYGSLGLLPFLVILPFAQGNPAIWLVNYFLKLKSANVSPFISSSLNFWWLITDSPVSFNKKLWFWPYKTWAITFYGLFYFLVILKLIKEIKIKSDWLLEALFLVYLGYFNLAPQVHERHIYPAILFLNILIEKKKYQLVFLFLLTITFLMNIFTAWPEFPSFFAILKIPPFSQLINWLISEKAIKVCIINVGILVIESIILFFSLDELKSKQGVLSPNRKHK